MEYGAAGRKSAVISTIEVPYCQSWPHAHVILVKSVADPDECVCAVVAREKATQAEVARLSDKLAKVTAATRREQENVDDPQNYEANRMLDAILRVVKEG